MFYTFYNMEVAHTVFENVFEYKYKILKSRRYITMDNVMTKGFAELSATEMEEIDGGVPAWLVALGAGWVLYEVGYAAGKAIAHITSK